MLKQEKITGFYNGVTRQPDTVRLPEQVEDAVNADFSVVTGGFSDRDPSQLVATLSGLSTDRTWFLHTIDRDATERYFVVISDQGDIKVFDGFDGSAKTVNYETGHEADITAYLTTGTEPARRRYVATTIIDTTILANREVTTALSAAGAGTVTGQVQLVSDLPATPADGDIYLIYGNPGELDDYYVEYVAADSLWYETAKPDIQNDFDATTMPFKIVRETDGTFTVSKIDWLARGVGDESTVPAPTFVGNPIRDLIFFKNRLGFISAQNVFFSQAGDYFNLWPDKALEVLDSDPIDVAATGSRVSNLSWGVAYRKTLFLTSDKAQFELSNTGLLTPSSAAIDEATVYSTSDLARPVVMGSELYFPSEVSGKGIVYEYYFNDATLSNTADDVTKHVLGFLPGSITKLTADPASGKLFVLCGDVTSDLYVYTTYWQQNNKVQSAWGKWSFDGNIEDIEMLNGELVLFIKRLDQYLLVKIAISDTNTDAGFNFLLDQKVSLTGSYDAPSNTTSWTLPYKHDDAVVALTSSDFSQAGRKLVLSYNVDGVTVSATGDYSGGEVIFGLTYETRVKISKLYIRDQNGKTVVGGRTQLRRLQWAFENTGYFEVHVTPTGGSTRIYRYTGRQVSLLNNLIGSSSISTGTFSHLIGSRNDAVEIEVVNPSFLPMTITSAVWNATYTNTRSR